MAEAGSSGSGGSIDLGLQGSTIVVTGAGSGIGAATARLLGTAGASVVLVARREALLRECADAIEQAGGHAIPLVAELADPASPTRVISAAVVAFGRTAWSTTLPSAGTSRCPSGTWRDSTSTWRQMSGRPTS